VSLYSDRDLSLTTFDILPASRRTGSLRQDRRAAYISKELTQHRASELMAAYSLSPIRFLTLASMLRYCHEAPSESRCAHSRPERKVDGTLVTGAVTIKEVFELQYRSGYRQIAL